jgi:inhibitor of cysteine peptidase
MSLFYTELFGFVSTGRIHNAELRKSFSMAETVILQIDREKTFQVSQDDVVLIRLEENPTTGYRWEVDAVDDRVVELQDSHYSMATGTGIGGGGVRTFTYELPTDSVITSSEVSDASSGSVAQSLHNIVGF